MTDERPFVSDAERRRHEHLSAAKPTSADRVSDRLNDLTAENNELRAEAATTERYLREQLRKAEAEARKPYADKIMALEADKRVLMEQVESFARELHDTREALEHAEAQRDTARAERNAFQDRLSAANASIQAARRDIQAARAKLDDLA